ncbi:Uu.00g117050.m01.CDS01 [Anthostomella pinea]|uniref:Uu.00g117050.m01.CDS01 n=1 Tax=Anthostomella pinea TaxID=933095 RepID=A0AAI8VGP0_9PEZI|nr:Uu.00g117050.m01.CDS01 [Anthostomella pinea]
MASPFTDAQMEILERTWTYFVLIFNQPRPMKQHSAIVAMHCSDVGSEVTSQQVGRFFAERAADIVGRPRAQAKSPRQLRLLEDSFNADAYPTTAELIILTHQMGLKPAQVKVWFVNKRRRIDRCGGRLFTRRHRVGVFARRLTDNLVNAPQAARMWRQYEADGGFYAIRVVVGKG